MCVRYFYNLLYSDGETEKMVGEHLIKEATAMMASMPLYPVGTRVAVK